MKCMRMKHIVVTTNKRCSDEQLPQTHHNKTHSNNKSCRYETGTEHAQLEHEDWYQIVKNQRLNTKAPQQIYKNNMQNLLYYYQTLEVGQHHTMDPIMEGILSCSLASSRGHPPIELPLQIQYFSSCLITLLEPLYIVLPSPKNILEEESSRSRTF
jgi:hypothetical protein